MTNGNGKGGKSHFYTGDIRYSLIEQIDLLSLEKFHNLSLKIFSRKTGFCIPLLSLFPVFIGVFFLTFCLSKCGKLTIIIIFPSSYIGGLFLVVIVLRNKF